MWVISELHKAKIVVSAKFSTGQKAAEEHTSTKMIMYILSHI